MVGRQFKDAFPGFYGFGRGIIAALNYSYIGYAQKFDPEKIKEHGKTLHVHFRQLQDGRWSPVVSPDE